MKKLIYRVFYLLGWPFWGAVVSYSLSDWTWFARSGSLMVVFSIIDFAMSYGAEKQAELVRYLRDHSSPEDLTTEDLAKSSHGEIIKLWGESRHVYLTAIIGGIFGTFIWGFGDLLGLLFR